MYSFKRNQNKRNIPRKTKNQNTLSYYKDPKGKRKIF